MDKSQESRPQEADGSRFSLLTEQYLSGRPKSERSPLGQFITPRILRERLAEQVQLFSGARVLDPGVGTGEFLRTCLDLEPSLYVEGWDIDPAALSVARELIPEATLKRQSALEQPWDESFDIVIGNPPYFEMPGIDQKLKVKYREVIGGRPNIFSLFFAAGLGALKPGGVLAYVVPPSMNNGSFFSNLREFISKQTSIEFLEIDENKNHFDEVQTAVQLIVLRKSSSSMNFKVDLGQLGKSRQKRIIFSENPSTFELEFQKRSTLWHLGYEAVTGSLVWNQHKGSLRREKEEGAVPLLWAHNITEHAEIVLKEDHPKKCQYVIGKESKRGPAIIVNRITGSVGKGTLRCAIVPEGQEYLAENHVNVIRERAGAKQLVDWVELLRLLRLPGISERVQLLTGNTQLSCVELTHWLPIDTELAKMDRMVAPLEMIQSELE